MPIPSPRKGETQDGFMTRCMGDEVMKKEFTNNKQRVAVCSQKWRDKNKKDSSEAASNVEELIEAFLERHPELLTEE